MLGEWSGASVEPGGGKPTPDIWSPVEVPGRPPAFADAEAAAYRTEFDDPRGPDEERAVLELRGLYAHARVWLNDELIGSHDAYFRPFRFSFEPEDENELVVVCRRPEDRFGGIHDTVRVPDVDSGPGIWWGVDVETHPETFIYDLHARPRLVEGDAKIDVECVVESETGVDDRLTFSLRPEGEFQSRGMMDRASVKAGPGERVTVEHTIEVRDPSLWWPRELGPQHRYSVRAKLDGATRSVTTGLCSVARGENGLLVNGKKLPARGVNLLDATTDDVAAAVDANANLVRVNAHAPPHRIYERCCNEGLLVWQDLPLTGPGSFGVERGRDVASDLVAAYDHHPCLAAFGVHDEPLDRSGEPFGAGFVDRLRLRWQAWRTEYDHGPADTIAAELPEDRPAFPVVGPLGTAPDAAALYPGWDHGDATDIDWLCDRYDLGDVVAAFGAGALGAGDHEELAGFDAAKHDAHVGADADAETSQRYQAGVLKRVAETLRRRDATLVAAAALRDTGDAGMGILERDGTEKLGYEAVANAFEPVQATLVEPAAGASSDVTVVNDTDEAVAGSLAWQVGDDEGEADVEVDAHDTQTVTTVTLPADADSIEMILSAGDHMVENQYHL
jgi:beta-mannosidase